MNTFWLKVAGVGVLVVAVLIVGSKFMGGEKTDKPVQEETSTRAASANVYEQDARDHELLNAPIQLAPNEVPPIEADVNNESVQQEPVSIPLPEFAKLNEAQLVEVEKLWELAETSFKIGRKPMVTFGNCVRYARQIIQGFPNTEYAIRAKRMLNEIVEMRDRYKEQYHITDEELDMGAFQ